MKFNSLTLKHPIFVPYQGLFSTFEVNSMANDYSIASCREIILNDGAKCGIITLNDLYITFFVNNIAGMTQME